MINDEHDTNTRKCNDDYHYHIETNFKSYTPELMMSRCPNTLKMYQGFVYYGFIDTNQIHSFIQGMILRGLQVFCKDGQLFICKALKTEPESNIQNVASKADMVGSGSYS